MVIFLSIQLDKLMPYEVLQMRTGENPLLTLLERALAVIQCKVIALPHCIAVNFNAYPFSSIRTQLFCHHLMSYLIRLQAPLV